jgi:hypothetical protein
MGRMASRRVRSFFATKAVNPPVEVAPAITSAILAIHMGHMGISPFALMTNEPVSAGHGRQIFQREVRNSFVGRLE